MKITNWFSFNKIKSWFNRDLLKAVKFIPKYLSNIDKIVLLCLVFVIAVAGFFLWHGYWVKNTKEIAVFGGTFNEGIVGKPSDVVKHVSRLTGAGLTKLQDTGEVKGDIAESWEIADGGKTYRFKLRSGFNSYDLASQLQNKNIWQNIEIATPEESILEFKFKQPFSPFLYISTDPVFDYGPYKVVKEEKTRITLIAQDNYWQGRPYINKIVLHLYNDENALIQAAKRGEIDGYAVLDSSEWKNDDSRILEMSLPRELLVFFNLNKDGLKIKSLRQSLRDNKALDKDYTFVLVTSDNEKNLKVAENLKAQWAPLKVNLEIKKYDNATLQKDIIPKREYDLLLYGLDYGQDPDPYPFWHSSQIKPDGMNLSNYTNKQADKLLEDARTTFDFKTRDDKYTAFQKILNEDVPFIKISQEKFEYVLNTNVRGIDKIYGFNESDRFLNIWQWYVKTKRVRK